MKQYLPKSAAVKVRYSLLRLSTPSRHNRAIRGQSNSVGRADWVARAASEAGIIQRFAFASVCTAAEGTNRGADFVAT